MGPLLFAFVLSQGGSAQTLLQELHSDAIQ